MLLKVWEVKSGQKNVTIPRSESIRAGDYVFIRKATAYDLAHRIIHKTYWHCESCKNYGCSEQQPNKCPFCDAEAVLIISENHQTKPNQDMPSQNTSQHHKAN